jgi:enoyl-CoA hydratase/carnithine racemase
MIRTEVRDEVALVQLDRPVTNALGPELVHELGQALQGVRHDPLVRGLVLASSNDKFFSIGFDIPRLFELPREEFQAFYRDVSRVCLDLYTLPRPTIAAITGHATAGGCILALCCDYRFIAEGRKLVGLNEIRLGVPVPYLADCILRHLVGVRLARDVVDSGEFYPPATSYQMGLVDQVLPLEQVVPAAVEKARSLGAWSQEAFALIKRNRVEGIEAQVLAHQEQQERAFVERWYSAEARARLKEAIEKF